VTIDRQWLRDIGIAVLLALPTAALTRPAAHEAKPKMTTAPQVQLVLADRSAPQARFSLNG
jgi:hypothetical protein